MGKGRSYAKSCHMRRTHFFFFHENYVLGKGHGEDFLMGKGRSYAKSCHVRRGIRRP